MRAIFDEVVAPDMIAVFGPEPYTRPIAKPQTTAFRLLLRNLEPFAPSDALDPLVIDEPACNAQQRRDLAIPGIGVIGATAIAAIRASCPRSEPVFVTSTESKVRPESPVRSSSKSSTEEGLQPEVLPPDRFLYAPVPVENVGEKPTSAFLRRALAFVRRNAFGELRDQTRDSDHPVADGRVWSSIAGPAIESRRRSQ